MQAPDRFFEKFSHMDPKMRNRNPELESIPMTRAALAMCESIDWNVGRVLAKLDELKLAGATIGHLLQRQRAEQLALELTGEEEKAALNGPLDRLYSARCYPMCPD